jgi:Domain of unknown function (DUF4136)
MERRPVVAAVCTSLLLGAPPVRAQALAGTKAAVDYERAVDFETFHTFRWRRTQDRLADPARHVSVVTAIERELERKGLRRAPDEEADLDVRFYASVKKYVRGSARQSTEPWGGDLRTSIDLVDVAECTLVIELYHAGTDHRIWRGRTTSFTRDPSHVESLIDSAVALIFRSYPPVPEP